MERVTDKAVVFLPWSSIEAGAQQQILNTAQMPFIFKHVAVMPDCHYGKGATVGTVLPTDGAIVPAAVGVDIGCPMIAGRNNASLTNSAAERVRALEVLGSQDGGNPDQYDRNWRRALGTLGG